MAIQDQTQLDKSTKSWMVKPTIDEIQAQGQINNNNQQLYYHCTATGHYHAAMQRQIPAHHQQQPQPLPQQNEKKTTKDNNNKRLRPTARTRKKILPLPVAAETAPMNPYEPLYKPL